MTNTNAEAIRFSNELARTSANAQAQLYYRSKEIVTQWGARSMGDLIPDDLVEMGDSAFGTDGTDGDGRPVITNAMVRASVAEAQAFVDAMEANSSARLNAVLSVANIPTR